jgi:hypothetical protein
VEEDDGVVESFAPVDPCVVAGWLEPVFGVEAGVLDGSVTLTGAIESKVAVATPTSVDEEVTDPETAVVDPAATVLEPLGSEGTLGTDGVFWGCGLVFIGGPAATTPGFVRIVPLMSISPDLLPLA